MSGSSGGMGGHRQPLTKEMIVKKTSASRLGDVKQLSIYAENINDITIVAKLRNLHAAAFVSNWISELKPFAACSSLQELYLRKNNIVDLAELNALRGLRDLRVLWLADNPCSQHPFYRKFAIACCAALTLLDETPVTMEERSEATALMTPSFVEKLLIGTFPANSPDEWPSKSGVSEDNLGAVESEGIGTSACPADSPTSMNSPTEPKIANKKNKEKREKLESDSRPLPKSSNHTASGMNLITTNQLSQSLSCLLATVPSTIRQEKMDLSRRPKHSSAPPGDHLATHRSGSSLPRLADRTSRTNNAKESEEKDLSDVSAASTLQEPLLASVRSLFPLLSVESLEEIKIEVLKQLKERKNCPQE